MSHSVDRNTMDKEWIQIRIRSIIKEITGLDLTENDMEYDLISTEGFDSLTLMEIFARMEERFSFEIDLNSIQTQDKFTPNMLVELAAQTLSDDQLNEPYFIKNTIPDSGCDPEMSGDEELDLIIEDIIERNNSDLFEIFKDVSNFEYVYLSDALLELDDTTTLAEVAKNHLLNKEGTCVSSSCALHFILRRLGYKSKLYYGRVQGWTREMPMHMWNEISVNGERYILDTFLYMKYKLVGYYGLRPDSALYRYEIRYDTAAAENIPDIKKDAKTYVAELLQEMNND